MLAIVILNYNNSKDTIECLLSIDTLVNRNFRVFLGDNSSNLDEYNRLENFLQNKENIKEYTNLYRINNNKGFGSGNNSILKKIDVKQYNNILLLNNDTLITDVNLIDVIYDKIKERENDKYILGCKILNNDFTIQESRGHYPGIKNEIMYSLKLHKKLEKNYDYLSGAFLVFNSELLKDIGFFDENFFLYFEEVDLIYRAKRAGYELEFLSETEIIHKGGQSTGGLNEFTVENYLKSLKLFLNKNFKYNIRIYIFWSIRNVMYFMNIVILKILCLISKNKNDKYNARIEWCKINLKKSYLLLQ